MALSGRIGSCLIAVCAGLPAQHPARVPLIDASTVLSAIVGLGTERGQDVAWAAHDALQFRLSWLGGELRRALQRWRSVEGDDARLVRLLLVDAMCGLEITVPEDELGFLLSDDRAWAPAFLILFRQHRRDPAWLLRLAMNPAVHGQIRDACCVELVNSKRKQPRFAAHLVDRAAHRLEVVVVDPGGTPQHANVIGPVLERVRNAPGFPPAPRHLLWLEFVTWSTRPHLVVTACGCGHMVCHVRQTAEDPAWLEPAQDDVGPLSCLPTEWLGELTGYYGHIDCRRELVVEWRDADDLRARVAQRQRECRIALDALTAALRQQEWIHSDEHPLGIPVATVVVDQRRDRSMPLPQIEQEPGGR